MSRPGTTKAKIRSRRAGGKKTRLIILAKRAGIVLCLASLVTWLAIWAWLAAIPEKAMDRAGNGISQMAASQGLQVKNVLVEGRINTDAEMLRSLIGVKRGDPLLSFNPREVKDLLERLSWIKSARVERRLPDTVYIGLSERKPMALWQYKGKLRLIDGEGVTLADRDLDRFRDLLILVGENAPAHGAELTGMLMAEPVLNGKVEAATWIGDRRWDILLRNGVTVSLPEIDPEPALRRVSQAQEENGLLDRPGLKMIDAREPGRLTVQAAPGAVQEYEASVKEGNSI